MKKYKVTVEIHYGMGQMETKVLIVEAGTKKLASIRALSELSADGYGDVYKNVKSIEEDNQNGSERSAV